MEDMELEDLDSPSHVPSRTSRFAPKFGKFKPHPKSQPKPEPSAAADPKQELKTDEPPPENPNGAVKMEMDEKPQPMEEDNGMEEEEDRVVREIDVFLTPSIDESTQLYVLQYPLRPCWRPYELEDRCEEVRVKPETAEVEVDLSVDVDSANYESNSQLSMTKQVLSSSWVPPRTSGCAVGILRGNKLYLNPINAVVQLRPSMAHLTPSDSKSTDVKESWLQLKYHSSRSDLSSKFLQKMMALESSSIQFSMSPSEYVNSLCPGASFDRVKRKERFSKRHLLSLPLEERFGTWVLEGPPVHRFSALMHLAPDSSTEEFLGVLRRHARMVQGLWVPKSSLLYDDGQKMQRLARDYVLLLFSKNATIRYSQLEFPKALRDAVKGILKNLAVERPTLGDWKFIEPADMSFIKLHPDIVKEEEQSWEAMEAVILNSIHGSKRGGQNTKDSMKPPLPETSKVSDRIAKSRAANGTLSGRNAMSAETREALPMALLKLFQVHKVCNFQFICQGLRDMAVSQSSSPKIDAREVVAAALGVDAPPEELHEVISQVAINVHGVYVLKSSSEQTPFRDIVIKLFCGNAPNAKLKKADILQAAKLVLNRDVPDGEYNSKLICSKRICSKR
ncbi:DNA-directed RNA polymerase III subunit Rpc5, partial [Dillenia turbinata]